MKDELNLVANDIWKIDARTTSREDFKLLNIILTKSLNKKALITNTGITEILILGTGGCGKSLIADSIVHELFDNWNTEAIPDSNKMCFERRPVHAAQKPLVVTDTLGGQRSDVFFYSDYLEIESYKHGVTQKINGLFKGQNPTIAILSAMLTINLKPIVRPSALTIEVGRSNNFLPWCHHWKIKINDPRFQTSEMRKTLQDIEKQFSLQKRIKRLTPAKPSAI